MGLRDIRRVLERGGNGVKLTCDAVKTLLSCGRSVFDELDGLVGLENFKEFFHRARDGMIALGRSAPGSSAYIGGMDSCRLMNARRPANIPDFAMNMCLVGPKGTGKTTAARLYGRLCYECGLLPSTRLCAVTGRDLISEYVGGTAEKTNHLILDSLGGTLFIDEAYTLAMSGHGEEAVGQLVQRSRGIQGTVCRRHRRIRGSDRQAIRRERGARVKIPERRADGGFHGGRAAGRCLTLVCGRGVADS